MTEETNERNIARLDAALMNLTREVSDISADLGVATSSFTILNAEARSRVSDALRASEERRLELMELKLQLATREGELRVKDKLEDQDREGTKQHSVRLERLTAALDSLVARMTTVEAVLATQDEERKERAKNEHALTLQSRKMRWAFSTAVALAVANGVFALAQALWIR